MRALFINENLGGHRALHLHVERALAEHPEVEATFLEVPPPKMLRRLFAAPIPGLARLDTDLQPLRYQLAQSFALGRRLDPSDGVDLIHAYTQNAVLLSTKALRRWPSVVSIDATNLVNSFQLPYRRPGLGTRACLRPAMALEKRVFAAATLVVAQSEWAAAQLGAYDVEAGRIRVVPYGITIPPAPAPASSTREAGPPRIAFIGASLDRKGGWQLLRVFAESLADRARLTLVTRERVPVMANVDVIADALPGDPRIASMLEDTAVFVLPTEIDKSPYSVLEAMAVGVPVVATPVGAIPEMVPHGIAGLLVDVGDDQALGRAISCLLDDRQLRERLGAQARQRVADRYDARKTTESLIAVLEEACRRHQDLPEATRSHRARRRAVRPRHRPAGPLASPS